MFEKIKANVFFERCLGRPDIEKAYAMVEPTDSWFDTISTVHNSLKEIKEKPHQDLEIVSDDNLKLRAVYYRSESDNNITVICVHGYTSHAEREWAFPGLFYLSLGYNVLIPYQRAHGKSEGDLITFGAYEHLDMLKWVKKINELRPNDKIIIHGLSMGGGITLDLCDKEMMNVKGLIADAPSLSIKAFFENVSKEIFKKHGEKVGKFAIQRFNKEFNVDINKFERVPLVATSKYPILLSAGSMEGYDEIFKIMKGLNRNPTEIVILPGCNHGNGMYKQTELYQDAIKKFINSVL